MTPFEIRWTFADDKLRAKFSPEKCERIKEIYFRAAGRRWGFVVKGWPPADDGSPLTMPNGALFAYLSIHVEFDQFCKNADAVARVDPGSLDALPSSGGRFPYRGTMRIDLDDIDALMADRPRFLDTVTHEIGHVLGLGILYQRSMIRSEASSAWYVGTQACRAYSALLGEPFGSRAIPIQFERVDSHDTFHWDEESLTWEIMSGSLDNPNAASHSEIGSNVISAVSVGALEDIGYRVERNAAERFITTLKPPAAH